MIGRADMKDQKQRRYERLGCHKRLSTAVGFPLSYRYESVFGGEGRAVPDPSRPARRPALAAGAASAIRRPAGWGWDPCPTTEPILFEFWIHFADFPCLHCSIDGVHLGDDAVMSAAGRGGHFRSSGFSRREAAGHQRRRGALPAWTLPPICTAALRGLAPSFRDRRALLLIGAALATANFVCGLRLSEETGGNQLLGGSISLSPYPVRRAICASVSLRASTSFLRPPASGIVHHLWVRGMLSSNPSGRSRSIGGATRGSRRSASLRLTGLLAVGFAHMSDSLVRVSRRANGKPGQRERVRDAPRRSQPRSRRQRLRA
ncbi:hypothetical protein FNV43_RR01623 [Rhamnella rubrinervis]|uniref:Uncharacterized protein n=1 Tax=Rhamnella rubrinervis TaxID=2594499 RepID=A0A8K0MSG2_9ROSA|nr:hypothetical protein FNV43_RR01623 [Rhamnella rubrinervis]